MMQGPRGALFLMGEVPLYRRSHNNLLDVPPDLGTLSVLTLMLAACTKLPWREVGPPNHHEDKVDSDQQVVNKELSLCAAGRTITCQTYRRTWGRCQC